MAKKIWDEDITGYEQDWGGDASTSNLPISGRAVQKFLKQELNSRVGFMIKPEGSNAYYCFASEEMYLKWLDAPDEEKPQYVIASFIAPAEFKAVINLIGTWPKTILKGTLGMYLEYTFDVYNDTTHVSTGEDVIVTYTITNAGSKETVVESYVYGTQVKFGLDNIIKDKKGIINIRMDLASKLNNITTTAAVTLNVVDFMVSTDFDISKLHNEPTLTVAFQMSGTGTKTMHWRIDNHDIPHESSDDVTDTTGGRPRYLDISSLSDGRHVLQYYGSISSDGQNYYSPLYYREFVINRGGDEKMKEVMLSLDYDANTEFITDFDNLVITGLEQYLPTNIVFAAYHSGAEEFYSVPIYVNDVLQGTWVTVNDSINIYTFTPSISGEATIVIGDRRLNTNIDKTSKNITEINDYLTLDLRAQGKNNEDVEGRSAWTYEGIETNFQPDGCTPFDWTVNSGWDPDNRQLVIGAGNGIDINYAPLATGGSKTLEFEFGTRDVTYDDEIICDMREPSGKGLYITASEIVLVSEFASNIKPYVWVEKDEVQNPEEYSNIIDPTVPPTIDGLKGHTGSGDNIKYYESLVNTQRAETVSTRFKSDKTYRVAIVIYPTSGTANKCLTMLYVDGRVCGVASFNASDNFITSKKISFRGTDRATVLLKHIRCYDGNALGHDQILNNYTLYQPTLELMNRVYDRNDVLDANGQYSTDVLSNQLPVMIITGDIPRFENFTNKKDSIILDKIEFINMQDKTRSFVWENVYMTPQGTSSMAYPIKNCRPYTQKSDDTVCYNYDGTINEDRTYAFKNGSQEVKCWTIKADFAESSGTHNTGIARIWNQAMSNVEELKTGAQKAAVESGYKYDVRTTVDGFPIVMFYHLKESDPLIFMGKYNFNNDKSSESVFGFCKIPGFNKGKIDAKESKDGFYQFYRENDDETLEHMEERFLVSSKPSGATKYLLRANKADGTGWEFAYYEKSESGEWEKKGGTDLVGGLEYNSVECWEILSNGSHISLYLDTDNWDDEKLGWQAAFESRFPDVGSEQDTLNLKRLCKWIVSTRIADNDTEEDKKNKLRKFRDELADHWDVDKLLAYYIYLMRFGAVDQTTKNAMLTTEDGQHWYWINYDNDTILGVRNDGLLKYNPDIDRQSWDAQINDYCYAGHNSTLWNNLERLLGYFEYEIFKEIVSDESNTLPVRISEIDQALKTGGLTYDAVINMFNEKQQNSWCERVYNADAQFKYIGTYTDTGGVKNYLSSLQGARTAHREWWLSNRFNLFDSKWLSGEFRTNQVVFKSSASEQKELKDKHIIVEAGKRLYYGFGINDKPQEVGILLDPNSEIGKSYAFSLDIGRVPAIGDPFNVYSANNIRKLDLSELIHYLNNLDLKGVTDSTGSTKLEELILGKDDDYNTSLVSTELKGLKAASRLKRLDVTNYRSLTTLDTESLYNLEILNAKGTAGLQSLTFRDSNIREIHAEAIKTLTLEGCRKLETLDINTSSLTALTVSNCSYDFMSMLMGDSIPVDAKVTMKNINWSEITCEELLELVARRGSNLVLEGHIHLSSESGLTDEQIATLNDVFNEPFKTTSRLYISADKTLVIEAPEGGLEGSDYTIIARNLTGRDDSDVIFSLSGQEEGDYITTDGVLHTANRAVTRNIIVTAVLRQSGVEVSSKSIALHIEAKTYPEALYNILGDIDLWQKGEYEYKAIFMPDTFTGSYEMEWQVQSTADISWRTDENRRLILVVNEIPELEDKSVSIVAIAHFDNGTDLPCALEVFVRRYTYPETAEIEGISTINKVCTRKFSLKLDEWADPSEFSGHINYRWSIDGADAIVSSSGASADITFRTVTDEKTVATITCVLWNLDKDIEILTTTKSINIFREDPVITSISNPELMRICYESGWSFDENEMYKAECEAVLFITDPLGVSVFKDNKTIESLDELKYFTGLTSLPDAAFNDCDSLTILTIPESVERIEGRLLNGCDGLESITIPGNVVYIGSNSFSLTSSLKSVTFEDSEKELTLDISCFNRAGSTEGTIRIPSRCKVLPKQCFQAANFNSIEIIGDEIVLGEGCFMECNAREIIIRGTTVTLNSSNFNACTSLESVTINGIVTSIPSFCFASSTSLKTVIMDTSNLEEIDTYALGSCYSLQSFNFSGLSSKLKRIGDYAFSNTSCILEYDLSGCTNLTTIGQEAFICETVWTQGRDWNQPSEILLPENLRTIGSKAFSHIGIAYIVCYMIEAPEGEFFGKTGTGDPRHGIVYTNKTLTCPAGSTGYDKWLEKLGDGWTLIQS